MGESGLYWSEEMASVGGDLSSVRSGDPCQVCTCICLVLSGVILVAEAMFTIAVPVGPQPRIR